MEELDPPTIGDYAEQLVGSGTTPQAGERLQAIRKFLSFARKKGLIEKNLARHVRIRKLGLRKKLQQTDNQERIELTAEGYAQLTSQLDQLRGERGPLAIQIRKAAADKDVRENVPLEAAREQLGLVESRIRDLENTVKFAAVIDPSRRGPITEARIGTRVSVKDLTTDRETTYTLVDRSEANPMEGKISDVSPLGKVLMRRSPGQEVVAVTPRGSVRYRIMEVIA